MKKSKVSDKFRLHRRRASQEFPAPRLRKRPHFPQGTLFILPNLFTSASIFFALFSLFKAAEGNFVMACWLIIASAACDVLDGPVARLTRTSSSFGLQYDSLADVIAFGVAPAFLIFQSLGTFDITYLPNYAQKLSLGACALYAICAAIRLARFNVQSDTAERLHFTGLPTPAAAGAVVTAFLFVQWLAGLPAVVENGFGPTTRVLHRSILILMVGLAFLMVSEIPFPKFKNLIKFSTKPFNVLVGFVVAACVLIAFQNLLPVFLFAAFSVYILGSVAFGFKGALGKKPSPEAEAES